MSEEEPTLDDLQRLVESTQEGRARSPQPAPRQNPPRQVGPYVLVDLLGRGAMGSVHRARDLRTGRDVALKLPLADASSAKRMERFRREGQATAALDHPNVVRIHELGVGPGGVPYLAYELIEGARVFDEFTAGLSVRRRVELVRDAARALGQAHERGILHRDLKPENLLIDRAGNVKVADFGLAQVVGLEALTQTGAIIGTPRTMAPEQIGGQRELYCPGTDVWALGVVLYQALTDEYPFDGENLIALASAIHRTPHTPPGRLVRGLAPQLDEVCRRALAKAPADRYLDGDALAEALDACLALPELTGIRPPRRWALAAAGLVILALAAVGLRLTRSAREDPATDPSPAVEPAARELTPKELRAGERALGSLRLESNPRSRAEAAKRWLAAYPGHPAAADVRALGARARLEFPILRMPLAGGWLHTARWIGDEVITLQKEQVRLWSLEGELVRAWPFEGNPARIAVSPDQRSVVIWGDGFLLSLDPRSETPHFNGWFSPLGEEGGISDLSYSPVAARVAGTLLTKVVILDVSEGTPRVEATLPVGDAGTPLTCVSWSLDGTRLLVGRGFTGQLPVSGTGFELWDVAARERVGTLSIPGRPRASLWLPGREGFVLGSSNGDLLLTSEAGEVLRRFRAPEVQDRSLVSDGLAHSGSIGHLTLASRGAVFFSASGQRVGSPSRWSCEVRAWTLTSEQPLPVEELPALFDRGRSPLEDGVTQLEVSPDGRHLLFASGRGIDVWSLPE